jgi:hypothetical protein
VVVVVVVVIVIVVVVVVVVIIVLMVVFVVVTMKMTTRFTARQKHSLPVINHRPLARGNTFTILAVVVENLEHGVIT